LDVLKNFPSNFKDSVNIVGTSAAKAAVHCLVPALNKHFEAKLEAAKAGIKQATVTDLTQCFDW
jgi:hypothetical protein